MIILQQSTEKRSFTKPVTCLPTARQRIGKHIPARENAHKNRMSTARQRISKHTPLIIEVVFSVGSVQSGHTEVFGGREQ
jgi:hypothetical protein